MNVESMPMMKPQRSYLALVLATSVFAVVCMVHALFNFTGVIDVIALLFWGWVLLAATNSVRGHRELHRVYAANKELFDKHLALKNQLLAELDKCKRTWSKQVKESYGFFASPNGSFEWHYSWMAREYTCLYTVGVDLNKEDMAGYKQSRAYLVKRSSGFPVLVQSYASRYSLIGEALGEKNTVTLLGLDKPFKEAQRHPLKNYASEDELNDLLNAICTSPAP